MSGFELDWNGKELTAEVRGACRETIKDVANDVAEDARRNCPEDDGDLKKTIEVVAFEKIDAVGAYVKAGGEDLGHVARFVELGTPGTTYNSGKKKGKARKPVKAKPYLRPALNKHRRKMLSKFRGKLK